MPKVKVGGKTKHFPYTPAGMKAAKASAKRTGKKVAAPKKMPKKGGY